MYLVLKSFLVLIKRFRLYLYPQNVFFLIIVIGQVLLIIFVQDDGPLFSPRYSE